MTTECKFGRANVAASDKPFLWAMSGGHCANPECHVNLFASVETRRVLFGELAHIIPASFEGPRDEPGWALRDRASPLNIILLCANCHTIVDKAPEVFDAPRLFEWQRAHMIRIESLFGGVEVRTRPEARALLEPLLAQNRAVFETYGPVVQQRRGRHGREAVRHWERKVREVILPNNRRLLALCERNRGLLNAEERAAVQVLRNHIDDQEARHFKGQAEPESVRFPTELDGVFA